MLHRAYLLLGSNIEPRLNYIKKALSLIEEGIVLKKKSSIYETAPWQMKEGTQAFLNIVVETETEMGPEELLSFCISCESQLGRIRTSEVSSRTIDVDILLFDNIVIQTGNLIIPHPRMHLRRFTLMPLAEIAPDVIHPVLHESISELLVECEDDSEVKKL